ELRDSQHLHESQPGLLRELVQRCVADALARLRRRRSSALQESFIELEQHRLEALLCEWLEIERGRPPFTVLGCEEERAASVARLELRRRLDRGDRLAAGEEILIDYKGGASSLTAWYGDRPDEPQLPLYAVTHPRTPHALAFAQVARGECGFIGLTADLQVAPGVRPFMAGRFDASRDWGEFIANRRVTLERLAQGFRSGQVPV